VETINIHCKKRESVSALWRDITVHTTDDSLRSKRNIFTATHRVFLHEIGRDPLHQQGGNFFRQIGWEWGKIPTWWEKSLCGNGNRAEKNSDMVGKIPTWLEKF
jgi:hypothetical protein